MTMLQFAITPTIRDALGIALSSAFLPNELCSLFREYYTSLDSNPIQIVEEGDITNEDKNYKTTIPFPHIQELSACLRKMNIPKGVGRPAVWVHELISGSEITIPSIKKPTPSEEQLKERSRIQALYDNMKYDQMTKNVTTTKEDTERMEQAEMSDFKSQIGMGMNMMLAAFTAMMVGWFVGTKWLGILGGVIVGLFVAIAVLVAEVGLFIINLNRVDAAQANRAHSFLPATVRSRSAPPAPIPKEVLLQMRSGNKHKQGEIPPDSAGTLAAPAGLVPANSKRQDGLNRRKEPRRKQK